MIVFLVISRGGPVKLRSRELCRPRVVLLNCVRPVALEIPNDLRFSRRRPEYLDACDRLGLTKANLLSKGRATKTRTCPHHAVQLTFRTSLAHDHFDAGTQGESV
jgi:hypothetical protein